MSSPRPASTARRSRQPLPPAAQASAPDALPPVSTEVRSETENALARIKPGYPAVALPNVLLQHFAIDFRKYRRNVATSNALWSQWNAIYEDILTHIDKVEKAENEAQWTSFSVYTAAIGPLEDHMLNLKAYLSANEKPPVPGPDDMTVLIVFSRNYAENRQVFVNAKEDLESPHFTNLASQPRKAKAEVLDAIKRDDEATLQELAKKIESYPPENLNISDSRPTDNFILRLRSKTAEIVAKANELTRDDFERKGKLVFALQVLYIPFMAFQHKPDNAHYLSRELWIAVLEFADKAFSFSGDKSIPISQFDEAWTAYEKVLLKEADAFTLQMITLMRMASKVRRPFFGRTVGVVRMWQALSESSELRAENKTSQRQIISNLLIQTLNEFTNTTESINSFSESEALQKSINDRKEGFATLTQSLKAQVERYARDKWPILEEQYNKGAEVDDKHLESLYNFAKLNPDANVLGIAPTLVA